VDFWRRMMDDDPLPERQPPEPLSDERITAGYRMYWTKTAYAWDAGRRQHIAGHLAAVFETPGFENNLLERRFRVPDLDDQAHSGASLQALAEVLRALDIFDHEEDNE